ncbi:hypothetical protein [Flavobacterium beibuense]|uniref:hypothetical protein n=1 Tax=Flavobacterium beibuense TaxID=657326 RepID=UPI003A928A25
MANQLDKNPNNRDIDFDYVSGKVKGYFTAAGDRFFDAILFAKKYFIILLVIIIGSGVWGYFKDENSKPYYENNLFVIPNFKSMDYLYSKIDYLSSKVGDDGFFQSIGLEPKSITKIEVKPVVDVFSFVKRDDRIKYEVLKLMSDSGEISKILEETVVGKNYKYHVITFNSGIQIDDKTIEALMNFLNDDEFYQTVQAEWVKNLEIKIAATDTLLMQIDGMLNSYTRKGGGSAVFFNQDMALDEVILQKQEIVDEQAMNRLDRINYTKIIKDSSKVLNIEKSSFTRGRMTIIMPLFFVTIFAVLMWFIGFYKRQVKKRQSTVTGENE